MNLPNVAQQHEEFLRLRYDGHNRKPQRLSMKRLGRRRRRRRSQAVYRSITCAYRCGWRATEWEV
jgi:hypothetical protein